MELKGWTDGSQRGNFRLRSDQTVLGALCAGFWNSELPDREDLTKESLEGRLEGQVQYFLVRKGGKPVPAQAWQWSGHAAWQQVLRTLE